MGLIEKLTGKRNIMFEFTMDNVFTLFFRNE
jgi:hypothetical protein